MKTIEQLQEENAALAAQVEALRGGIEKAKDELSCCNVNSASERLAHLLEIIPQHHLRELRAEAGRAGFVQGCIDGYEQCGRDIESGDWTDDSEDILRPANDVAYQYAEQIRQGEVE